MIGLYLTALALLSLGIGYLGQVSCSRGVMAHQGRTLEADHLRRPAGSPTQPQLTFA